MAAKIRKGDRVVVIAGRDKGKTGEVRQVIPTERPRDRRRGQPRASPHPPDARRPRAAS